MSTTARKRLLDPAFVAMQDAIAAQGWDDYFMSTPTEEIAQIGLGAQLGSGFFTEEPKVILDQNWLTKRLFLGSHVRFCEELVVTPAMAEELLTDEMNKHNRDQREGRIRQWARAIEAGLWRLSPEAIAISKEGFLLDGQHRLEAIIEAGIAVPMTVWWGRDLDEFNVIGQQAPRSGTDLLKIGGRKNAKILSATLSLLLRFEKDRSASASVGEINARAAELGEEIDIAVTRGMAACKKTMIIESVAACAYFLMAREASTHNFQTFWEDLCDAGHTNNIPAVAQLCTWSMRNRKTTVGIEPRKGEDGEIRAQKGIVYGNRLRMRQVCAIVLAYNAWIRGRKGRDLTWDDDGLPPIEKG